MKKDLLTSLLRSDRSVEKARLEYMKVRGLYENILHRGSMSETLVSWDWAKMKFKWLPVWENEVTFENVDGQATTIYLISKPAPTITEAAIEIWVESSYDDDTFSSTLEPASHILMQSYVGDGRIQPDEAMHQLEELGPPTKALEDWFTRQE